MTEDEAIKALAEFYLEQSCPRGGSRAGLNHTWEMHREDGGELTLDAFTPYGPVTPTLREPEQFLVEFIKSLRDLGGVVMDLHNEPRKGPDGLDKPLTWAGNLSRTALHFFAANLPAKLIETLEESAEEAEALTSAGVIHSLEHEFPKRFGLDLPDYLQAESHGDLLARLLEAAARRRRVRLSAALRKMKRKTKGEVLVDRAVRLFKQAKRRKPTLKELAAQLTTKYDYVPEVTEGALRKEFARRGTPWNEFKKTGQIKSSVLSGFEDRFPVE